MSELKKSYNGHWIVLENFAMEILNLNSAKNVLKDISLRFSHPQNVKTISRETLRGSFM